MGEQHCLGEVEFYGVFYYLILVNKARQTQQWFVGQIL